MFWSMSRHVDRLRSDRDLRALNIALCAAVTAQGDKEFLPELRSNLMEQMGTITRASAPPVSSKADILALMNT